VGTVITLVVLVGLGVWAYNKWGSQLMSGGGSDSLGASPTAGSPMHEPGQVTARDGVKTTRVRVASKAELDAAVAEYTGQGFQLKAVSDTTASLERTENPFNIGKAILYWMLCILPGIIYMLKNPPSKKVGDVILIQVEASAE